MQPPMSTCNRHARARGRNTDACAAALSLALLGRLLAGAGTGALLPARLLRARHAHISTCRRNVRARGRSTDSCAAALVLALLDRRLARSGTGALVVTRLPCARLVQHAPMSTRCHHARARGRNTDACAAAFALALLDRRLVRSGADALLLARLPCARHARVSVCAGAMCGRVGGTLTLAPLPSLSRLSAVGLLEPGLAPFFSLACRARVTRISVRAGAMNRGRGRNTDACAAALVLGLLDRRLAGAGAGAVLLARLPCARHAHISTCRRNEPGARAQH